MRSPPRAITWKPEVVGRRRSIAKAAILPRCAKGTGVGWTARACTLSRTMVAKASSRSAGLDTGSGTTTSPRRGAVRSFVCLKAGKGRDIIGTVDDADALNPGTDLFEQLQVLFYGFNLAHDPGDVPTRS